MVDRYRVPEGFDPQQYVRANPDVVQAISRGEFTSAEDHFKQFGGGENREGSIGVPNVFLKPLDQGGLTTFSTTVTDPVSGRQLAGPSEIPSLPTTIGFDPAAVSNYVNANPDLKQDATEKGVYREDGSADSLELAKYAIEHYTSQGYKEDRSFSQGAPVVEGQNVVLTEEEIEEANATEDNVQDNVQDNVNAGGETSSDPISEGPLPSWLTPPPEGAFTNEAVTTYTNPETGETYTTSSGGYSVNVDAGGGVDAGGADPDPVNTVVTGGGDGLMSSDDVHRRNFYASDLRTQLEINANPMFANVQLPLGLEDTGAPFTSVETPLTPDQQIEAIATDGDPTGVLPLIHRENFYAQPIEVQEAINARPDLRNSQLPVGETDTGGAFFQRPANQPSSGGGGSSNVVAGGGGSNVVTGGGGSSNVVTGGGTGGGMMSTNLDPVLNRIGSPTVTNPSLFQGQAGLMAGQSAITGNQGTLQDNQQVISDKIGVAPTQGIGVPGGATQGTLFSGQAGIQQGIGNLGTQVTGVGEQVTGVGEQVTGVGEQVTGLGTQIGTGATDTAEATGLYKGQEGIMSGQTGIADTQADILEGQTGLAGTQAGLMSRIGDTATATTPATGLIGAVGTAGTPGTATQAAVAPTGLFAGQQTLGTNITGVGGQVTQVGQDVSGIASSLANFENISSQERANLLSTLNTRAQELENLENMYGFQTNRLVEAQLGNTGSTGLQPGMMQPPATDPGSLNSILAAEKAAQATGQNISANLTSAANQGLVSNALGPVGTQ